MNIRLAQPSNFPSISRLLFLIISGAILVSSACSGDRSKSHNSGSGSESVTENSRNPLPDLTLAAEAGKPLYAANCVTCHGDSGSGDGPAGTALAAKPTDLTTGDVTTDPDGKLFLVIKNGKMTKGKIVMPPVKRLTDEQIWQMVAYVRTLSKK